MSALVTSAVLVLLFSSVSNAKEVSMTERLFGFFGGRALNEVPPTGAPPTAAPPTSGPPEGCDTSFMLFKACVASGGSGCDCDVTDPGTMPGEYCDTFAPWLKYNRVCCVK